jgi:hypothetical protein
MRRDNAGNYLDGLIDDLRRLRALGYPWPSAGVPLTRLGDAEGYLLRRRLSPSTDVKQNDALGQAFEAFGLDPKDEGHWRLLLALFAQAYFEPRRPRGGPKQWDGFRLCQLLADAQAVRNRNPHVRAESKICELIKTTFRKRYADVSAETIRRRLRDARDPAKNDALRDLLKAWTPDPRRLTAEQHRAQLIEVISQRQWIS